jgi:hypothetical protein
MRQPQASFQELELEDTLFQHYQVLDPLAKEEETTAPTTRFVYEGLYSFLTGVATDQIPAQKSLNPGRAKELKDTIIVNTLELMSLIRKLGTREISFNGNSDETQHPLDSLIHNINPRGDEVVKTRAYIDYSLLGIEFQGHTQRLVLEHRTLNPFKTLRPYNGSTFGATLLLDHNRSTSEERFLCLDIHILQNMWGTHANGKYLPIGSRNLTHEYLGKNLHHIPLAIETNKNGSSEINKIKHAVMEDLGLSSLRDAFSE